MEEAFGLSQRVLEDGAPLLEEAPLLGEEEREARQVDLLIVRLHLGEVGVRGQVEIEVRGECVFDIQACFPGAVGPSIVGRPCDVDLVRVSPSGQRVGSHVERVRGFDSLEHHLSHLRRLPEAALAPARRDGWVDHPLVLPRDVSQHRNTHHDAAGIVLEEEAREGDADLCIPPLPVLGRRPVGVVTNPIAFSSSFDVSR